MRNPKHLTSGKHQHELNASTSLPPARFLGALIACFAGLLTLASPATASSPVPGQARFSWQALESPLVTGYKVHWGTRSGEYTNSLDVGNATSVIIGNFVEGVEYFSAITAYGPDGLESNYSEETSFIYDTSDRLLLIEAETGTTTGALASNSDANATWITPVSTSSPDGTLSLAFEAPYTTQFFVWCRVLAPDPSRDSLAVSMDGQPEHDYLIYGQSNLPPADYRQDWFWSRIELSPSIPRSYPLEAAPHVLRFRFSEAVALDRVVITSSPEFSPTDSLPRAGDFIEILEHPLSRNTTQGGSTTFTARFIATAPLEYHWFKNNAILEGSRQPSLTLTDVQPSDAGDYTLSASTGTANVITRPATLQVLPVEPSTVFRVRHLGISAQGELTFLIAGATGTHLGVYVSEDLQKWDLLTTVPNTGETLTITDSAATSATRRFYRLADLSSP